MQQFVHEMLDVIEALAFFAGEGEGGFGVGHADLEAGDFAAVINGDLRGITEVTEHDFENFPGVVDGIHDRVAGIL